MKRCPHCSHEIRYFQIHVEELGNVWHLSCWQTVAHELSAQLPAMREEDWELEARRHEARLDQSARHDTAYEYHLTKGQP